MRIVSADDINGNLPTYLQRVAAGETILVTQGGKPVAEIKPVTRDARELRPFGLCAGEFTVAEDFDEPLPESISADFEGR